MTPIDTSTEAVERLALDHQTVGDNPAKYVMGHPHHWLTAAVLQQLVKERDEARATPTIDPVNVQALVDALEFYADRDNYETVYELMPCDCCTDIYEPVKRDEGNTARAALAALKEARK